MGSVALTLASARRIGMVTQLKGVWSDFPTLKDLTVEITNHFSGVSLDGKVELASTAIRLSCTKYRQRKTILDCSCPQLHFLLTLYQTFGEAARLKIRIGKLVWDPLAESYPSFLIKGEPSVERNLGSSTDTLTRALMDRFLEKEIVKAMQNLE